MLVLAGVAATTPALSAQSGQAIPSVIVTLENVQPSRGTLFTPPWIAIHDGTFDSYDGGSPASVPLGGDEIERLAEDGNNGPISATFAALLPNAPQRSGLPGPFGPLSPGDRVSVTLNVDPILDRYFSYASMAIPSNDTFIANGSPVAHELFDSLGKFVGRDFVVSGDETNDAGTELNDEIAGNVAFLQQGAPDTGTPEFGNVVSPSPDFAAPGTLAYPDGLFNYPAFGNADYNDADDRLLAVRFRFVDLGGRVRFGSDLNPLQQVQPNLVASLGHGRARLVSGNAEVLLVRLGYANLSGPVQIASLNLGQAGTNGAVVVDLTPGLLGNGHLEFTANAADLTGPLAGQAFLNLVNELAAGNVYLNLATTAFPEGELRGQVSLSH